MYVFCFPCPSATFTLQRGGFAPREWLAAKGLLHSDGTGKIRQESLLLVGLFWVLT